MAGGRSHWSAFLREGKIAGLPTPAFAAAPSKKMSKRQDQDANPTYGDYEYEDATLRKNTMEVIDQNEDYGQAVVRIE